MLVQYQGKKSNIFKYGKEYDIDYVCGSKGGYVIVDDCHQIVYDNVVDLALDWNILGDKFVRAEVMEDYMSRMVKLP